MSGNLNKLKFALITMLFFFVASVSAQTVKGTVIDNTGEPVIGASVFEDGTPNNGTATDLDGNFTLELKGNSKKIKVSYIGMKTQTINVAGKSTVEVKLEDDSNTLNDVVVIGYGTVKKKDLTGSVISVGGDKIAQVPVASATEALTGKMAGVQITTTEGSPDADVKIRVRGGGSITQSNEPLYVVDGFPVESISDIPANEIEDMTVLKDASSTAIYGSRGANGVILITTKSGKAGKTTVSYNAYYSWKKRANTLDVLDAKDYVLWQYERAQLKDQVEEFTRYFGNYQDFDQYDNIPTNDWLDQTYGRTGNTFNHNLNINGGTEKLRYTFSYAHMNDKAIMEQSSYARDNLSLKLNANPTKTTQLSFQARYAKTRVNGSGANDATSVYNTDKQLKNAMIYPPFPIPGLNPESGSADDELGNLYNPLVSQADNYKKETRQNISMNGSFQWEPLKNLKLKTEFGYNNTDRKQWRFWGTTTYYIKNVPATENQGKPATRISNRNNHSLRSTNTISYDFKDIFKNEDHSLNILAGHEYIETKTDENENEVHGFPDYFTSDQAWRLSAQGTPYTVDENLYNERLLSFFGRVNYNYLDKYLLSGTFRADASSKFASNNRWGYFPSAAVAWRISSEPFMKGTEKWLDDLKLRFSYGTAGNNNIPTGQIYRVFSPSATSWINGYNSYWSASKVMTNPDLKWETTITRNIGLDFTFFGGRLNGSVEGYWNTTKDLLLQIQTGGTGYDTQYRNMGKTENKGIEATINWTIVNKEKWGIDISANIGFNKNKIKSLGSMEEYSTASSWASTEIPNEYRLTVGEPIGQIYGYVSDGRYEVSDFERYDEASETWILKAGVTDASAIVGKVRPGTMKIKAMGDHEGEENPNISASDIVKIGDTNPTATGGFTINARAYGFDLSAAFSYRIGGDVYNANKIEYTSTGKYSYRNMITEMASGKRWTNLDPETGLVTNDAATLERLNANTTMWSPLTDRMVLTDWAIEDGSFLRLNTLTLGYTIPQNIIGRIGITNLRFYVTGYNLFCITGYSGFDPEVDAIRRTTLTPSVDYSAYPKSRQLVVGMNLNF